MYMTKIGVFDSGIGGKSVANRLSELFPEVEIIFVNDSKNVPYGTRQKAEIISLTTTAIQPLIDAKCDAIVIACNTATTNAISELRANFPKVHFVGLEPMVKPACERTTTKSIAVLATPSTLKSARYNELKDLWANGITVSEPDCSTWAELIEHDRISEINIKEVCDEIIRHNVDEVVLGCTHYHWIKLDIQNYLGTKIEVLEPSDAIGARLDSLLSLNSELPR